MSGKIVSTVTDPFLIQKAQEGKQSGLRCPYSQRVERRHRGRGPLIWLLYATLPSHCQKKKRCECGFKPGPWTPLMSRGLGGGCGNQQVTSTGALATVIRSLQPIWSHMFIKVSNPEEWGHIKEVNREGFSQCLG